jgi:hypothetical protein
VSHHRTCWASLGFLLAVGCSSQDDSQPTGEDAVDSGGGATVAPGGSSGSGGAKANGGSTGSGATAKAGGSTGSGGAKTGGNTGSGGTQTGGSTGSGGAKTGGNTGSGGSVVRDAAPRDAASPGVWRNITPAQVDPSKTACTDLKFDPQNPDMLFAYFGDGGGVWKSTDAGTTWTQIGNLPTPISLGRLWIDPTNSQHLYAIGSVRGASNGFWISVDGGNTWTMPAGFKAGMSSTWNNDVYNMAVDPTDFGHFILGFHTGWNGGDDAGVVESKDAGVTFTAHAPMAGMNHGQGIAFLYNPALGLGDKNTWLVGGGYAAGLFRTTDAGATWSKVSNLQDSHGGFDLHYSTQGFAYIGLAQSIARSTDNGLTWKAETNGVPYAYYYSVIGDGTRLYTRQAFVGVPYTTPFIVSNEGGPNEGDSWTTYGTQVIAEGPWRMVFDPVNRTIYNATWGSGAWALDVAP